jgi:hypothetical protein
MPNYNEIFMTQFIQTLAQLSAGVLTAVFAVPVYSYYVKGNLNDEYNQELSDINKEKSSNVNNDDRSTVNDTSDTEVDEVDEEENEH